MMTPPPVKRLPLADDLFSGQTQQLGRFAVKDSTLWSLTSPSICTTKEHGTLVLFKSSNGVLKDHRPEFQMPLGHELDSGDNFRYPSEFYAEPDLTIAWRGEPIVHNRLFISKMHKQSDLNTSGELFEVNLSEAYEQAPFEVKRGIENARLYYDGESLRILATIFEPIKFPEPHTCSIKLELETFKKARGTSFELLDASTDWMPVHQEDMKSSPAFDFVCESGKTYSMSKKTFENVGGYVLPLRGSSQLLPLDDGTFLGITHQIVLSENMRFSDIKKSALMRRRYVHRFVQYTSQGQVLKVTDPFNFINKSIEIANGIAIRKNRIVVTFGALDSSAHASSLQLDEVLDALRRPVLVS